MSHTNADNNTVIRGKMLKPYSLPFNISKRSLDDYLNNINKRPSKVHYVYNEFLGWNSNPNMTDAYNEQGILGPSKIFTEKPEINVLRIALFGDSMTRSSGRGFEKSWGYLLEKNLTELGYNVEVMNFGVGGYGIDQIYLRWEIEGKKYSPNLVIFGFYSVDIARCLEVHKLKNWGLNGGILFSKPRFLIDGGNDTLKIINYPTVPPDKLLYDTKSFDDLPYIQYDTVYLQGKSDYKKYFWRNSYLLRFIETNLADNRFTQTSYDKDSQYYDTTKEAAKLVLKIIKLFQHSVQEENANFFTLVLPGINDLLYLKNGRPLRYMHLIDVVEKFSPVIHAESKMKDYDDVKKFYIPNDGHFSSLGNEIVAKIVSEYLAENFNQLRYGKGGGSAQPFLPHF
jgi:lysophospholipase L1-like esterase